jgi:hypothetical protein
MNKKIQKNYLTCDENPYLIEFSKAIDNHDSYDMLNERWKLIKKFSFAIPDNYIVHRLLEFSPFIEIGAGNGYWAKLINIAGGDIVCYDDFSWYGKNNSEFWENQYYEVKKGNEKDILNHQDRTLFLCWPVIGDMAYNCISLYTGNTIVYIGEGKGGCTANDEFFTLLKESYYLYGNYSIPTYHGIHDSVFVYKKIKRIE